MCDTKEITFTVKSDTEPPSIVRVFHQESKLSVVTNENSTCVYSTSSCNYLFGDGTVMDSTDYIRHEVEWDSSKSFYIKCRDDFGNQPVPSDRCSLTVKPYQGN